MGTFASSPHYSVETCSEIWLIYEVVVSHFLITVNILQVWFPVWTRFWVAIGMAQVPKLEKEIS